MDLDLYMTTISKEKAIYNTLIETDVNDASDDIWLGCFVHTPGLKVATYEMENGYQMIISREPLQQPEEDWLKDNQQWYERYQEQISLQAELDLEAEADWYEDMMRKHSLTTRQQVDEYIEGMA